MYIWMSDVVGVRCGECPLLPMVWWMSGVVDVCVVDIVQSFHMKSGKVYDMYPPNKILFRKNLLSLSLLVVKELEGEGSKVRLRGDNNNRNSFLSKFTTPFSG